MSDLRETIKAMDSWYVDDLGFVLPEAFTVLEHFATGRLVDRDIIERQVRLAADLVSSVMVTLDEAVEAVNRVAAGIGGSDE